jgi:phage-related protein
MTRALLSKTAFGQFHNLALMMKQSAGLFMHTQGQPIAPFEKEYVFQRDEFKKRVSPTADTKSTKWDHFMNKISHISTTSSGGLARNYDPAKMLALPLKESFLAVGRTIGAISKEFTKIGGQMLKAQIITAPMQAFWTGFLEPLEPLQDIFGMIGEMLGTMLIPGMNDFMEAIMPIMPIFKDIAKELQPFFKDLFKALGEAFATILPVLGDLAKIFIPLLVAGLNLIITPISAVLKLITGKISAEEFIASIGKAIGDAFKAIGKFFLDFGGFLWDGLTKAFWGIVDMVGQFFIDVFWEAVTLGAAKTKTFG